MSRGATKRKALRDVANEVPENGGRAAKKSRKRSSGPGKRSTRASTKSKVAPEETQPKYQNAFTRTSYYEVGQKKKSATQRPVTRSRRNDKKNQMENPTSYQYTGVTDEIDQHDCNDPLACTDYVKEMYEIFKMKELDTSVRAKYLDNQPHINERMRAILVDWIVEVHLKFKLVPETLYLCVNLIDRYLAKKEITRARLQLVGVSSLLVAAKYEEIYPPELRDLVYICDKAYTRRDILDMEEDILKTLEYQITIPSAHAFLVRCLKAAHADKKIVQLSCYILDGTLQVYKLLDYLPSQLAAAAVLIARHSVGRNAWSPTLLKYAEYREEEILPIAKEILKAKEKTLFDLKAIHKKYTTPRYGSVAQTRLSIDEDRL